MTAHSWQESTAAHSSQILCVGLSGHAAPVAVREQLPGLSRGDDVSVRMGDRLTSTAECAVLSTCNRFEVYAWVPDKEGGSAAWLARLTGSWPASVRPYLYRLEGLAAVWHLFEVAAGLDSLALGEPQILGQVAEAFSDAQRHGLTGPNLENLFQSAIRAGKRARTQTGIGRQPATLSSVAARLAEQTLGDLTGADVVVLGAGEMASLTALALAKRGPRRMTVISRTDDHARTLASRCRARVRAYAELQEALSQADLVIAATSAQHPIVTSELLANRSRQSGRPLVLIDIAVPRNVASDLAARPGIIVHDIDSLHQVLHQSRNGRAESVPAVHAILKEELQNYVASQHALAVAPVLADLRGNAERIRRDEIAKTLRHWPGIGATERRQIEALSEALVNKLLRAPTLRLRAEAVNGRAGYYAALVRDLFELSQECTHDNGD